MTETVTNTVVTNTVEEMVLLAIKSETLRLQNIIDFQSKRLDDQEAMVASLTMAYMEMFSAVDMLIKTTIKGYTPEEQEQFLQQFAKLRSDVIKSIQEVSRSGVEGLDPEVRRAVENMAESNKSS